MTLADLAGRLGCRLEGDGRLEVTRVAGLDEAGPGDLTFLANPRYASRLAATRASAVIAGEHATGAPCAILRSAQPYVAVAGAITLLTPPTAPLAGISPHAAVDPTAEIGPGVHIGAFAVVGARSRIGARTVVHAHVVIGADVVVGDDVVLHAHVSLRDAVAVGHRSVLQDGAVVGSDGFGFARRSDGTHQKIPQVGRVVIEDDVEVGAQSAIDRPAMGETRIGAGTKIDNLVQVAHGVRIGRRVLLAAQVGIAGSTTLGDDVVMAGQSGAAGHLTLGPRVVVNAKSAVTKDVPEGHHVAGIPAGDVAAWREQVVLLRRLHDFRQILTDLSSRLAALEKKSAL